MSSTKKSKVKFGVVVFPGSNCDQDCYDVVQNVLGQEAVYLWHKDTSLQDVDCVIVPGGFSYGDYLRCGAIAKFSPIMNNIKAFANDGGYVLGICNGFQILLESGLLDGAMKVNRDLRFICRYENLIVENNETPFTNQFKKGQEVRIPIAHMEGNYHAGEDYLGQIEKNDQVLFRYKDNPNGSLNDIAGICNPQKNVLGMMPHPERCSEKAMLGEDGRLVFESLVAHLA